MGSRVPIQYASGTADCQLFTVKGIHGQDGGQTGKNGEIFKPLTRQEAASYKGSVN
jgi:hypothetical protein